MKLAEFVGTRARFQRLKDSKIFNGWIEQMSGNRVLLGLTGSAVPTAGDEYRVEGYGHMVSVVFLAKLEAILGDDRPPDETAQAERDLRLDFVVLSAARMVESSETVRYKLKAVAVQFHHDGRVCTAKALDASFTGIGVSCDEPVEPGVTVSMTIATSLGAIGATAVCRHCQEDPDRPGTYRAGFMFQEFGRVDKPKWDRFITNLR